MTVVVPPRPYRATHNAAPSPLAEKVSGEARRMRGRAAVRAVDAPPGSRKRRETTPPLQRSYADERAWRRDPSSGRLCRPPPPARGEGSRARRNVVRSAESAVDLTAASCFRSLAAVKDVRTARRLRRPQAIDSLETSEGHAVMRPTAWRVTESSGAVVMAKSLPSSAGFEVGE